MKRLVAVSGLLVSVGCARPAVVASAFDGDLASLKRDIGAAQAAHELDRSRVNALAAAVASREVRSATGEAAVRRLEQVRPCARQLLPVIRDRARRRDDAGATATLLLLEAGKIRPEPLVAEFSAASSGAWRAVAARAMVTPADAAARRQAIVDPDPRVRRGALAAAIEVPAVDDLALLLETARVDPDPDARRLAIAAIGGLGGPTTALALADRWARSSEPERRATVAAWGGAALFPAGGRERLVHTMESGAGMPALDAAATLVAHGGAEAEAAVDWLARGIGEATTPERRWAIRMAPARDARVRHALERAADDNDLEVRVMALARLVELPGPREKWTRGLRDLAQRDPREATTLQARAALAAFGDRTVHDLLVSELSAPRSYRRRLAALGLLSLADYDRAATALGDDDPYVRTVVACSILVADDPR